MVGRPDGHLDGDGHLEVRPYLSHGLRSRQPVLSGPQLRAAEAVQHAVGEIGVVLHGDGQPAHGHVNPSLEIIRELVARGAGSPTRTTRRVPYESTLPFHRDES